MAQFTLEEIYGVSRSEYCEITGITSDELVKHLEAEVGMLENSYVEISTLYRESALASPQLKYFENLLHAINKRIESKTGKILSLRHIIVKN